VNLEPSESEACTARCTVVLDEGLCLYESDNVQLCVNDVNKEMNNSLNAYVSILDYRICASN
jgi:hypothetical protein